MKVSSSTTKALSTHKGHSDFERFTAPLPLTYGTEKPREILQWQKDLETIRIGLNLKDPETIFRFTASQCYRAAKDAYLSRILDVRKQWPDQVKIWRKENLPVRHNNEPLPVFLHRQQVNELELREFEKPQLEWHNMAVREILLDALPYKILLKQKRYMHRFMRKPRDMKVQVYTSHLIKTNNDEILQLPPFKPNQAFKKDELSEIILFGVSMQWQHKMEKQNFDPDLLNMS